MKTKELFDEYLEYLRKKNYSPKTIKKYRGHLFGSLSHSVSEINVKKLTLVDTAKVIEAGKQHGVYGMREGVKTYKNYLRFLKDRGLKLKLDIDDIVVPTVPQKEVEYLTKEELDKIRERVVGRTPIELRTRAIIEVLFSTGMRISELLAVNIGDIDWGNREVKIENIKNHEKEKVYFTEESLAWVRKYLESRKDDCPALFASSWGKRIDDVTTRKCLQKFTKELGIKKHVCNHLFRKSFTTHLLIGGANIKEVQWLARHKSERTTLQYYSAVNKELAKKTHQKVMAGI